MTLTDANPAFGPTEQVIVLEITEIDRFGAIWIDSVTFEKKLIFEPGEPELRSSKIWFWELLELKIQDFSSSKNDPETS